MTKILSNYDVNEQTMALLPAAHLDYYTIVLDCNRQLLVKRTPLQLIGSACLKAGSSYDGRRSAVIYLTNSKKKIPIPIDPFLNIYAFPTCSPSQFHCHWIFYHHVKSIVSNSKTSQANTPSSIIFKNEYQLPMKESFYLLEKQMHRTAECVTILSSYHYMLASKTHQRLFPFYLYT
ncbi:competence protein ComK [Aquibacillus albus]|uniref:Competence protein ComK n=1 Tax=Aquibacillus albus TaxID=1168171 RepID=A0ABS2MZV9_9BACI|nr:competence protein ComK [Aquibacillus albus]MBM7571394.1 competence protein ComK [Aquibacillus albus]